MILGISDIQLASLVTHYVGNGSDGDHIQLSKTPVEIESSELKQILMQYFLSPFRETATYNLWHPESLELNDVMRCVSEIFSDPESFMLQSCNLARHLYDITTLPHIKSGELHVAYFTGCPVNGIITDAIGIYKTESKSKYLKLTEDSNGYHFQPGEGINPEKMDKGCLIFNTNKENGYLVHVIDKTAKGGESQFWKDNFLMIRAASDHYHATEDYIKLCKDFIVAQVPTEYEVEKVQQIDMLNKAVAYFKKNDQFTKEEFASQVFSDSDLIKSFQKYEKQYEEDYDVHFDDEFEISDAAVKKNARILKSVLKLDNNFHVYIHGKRELIERGYDDAIGLNYYKIYFETEQ